MVNFIIENRTPTEEEFPKVLDLMNQVWHSYYYNEGTFNYTRDFIDVYIKSPLQKNDYIWLAIDKDENKIVGVNIMTAQKMMILGQGPYLTGYSSLTSVDPNYQQHGIGRELLKEGKNIYKKGEFIGVFAAFEKVSKGRQTAPSDRRKELIPLWSHDYAYIRPLNVNGRGKLMNMKAYEKIGAKLIQGVKKVEDKRIRSVKSSDIHQILNLLNRYSKKCTFSHVWSKEELEMYIENPLYRGKVFVENDEVKAVISAIRFPFFAKGEIVYISMIENSHYENISFSEQCKLVNALMYDLKKEDVVVAIDFYIGYRSLTPLKKNRFIKYRRPLTLQFLPHDEKTKSLLSNIKVNNETTYIEIR